MEMSTKSERKLLKMLNFFVLIVVIFTVGAVVFEGRFTLYKFQNKFLFEILRLGTSSQMAIFTLGLFGLVTIGNFKNKYFPLTFFLSLVPLLLYFLGVILFVFALGLAND